MNASMSSATSNTTSLSLHKFAIVPEEDDGTHQFTLVLDNVRQLCTAPLTSKTSSVESSELSYGGQRWSVVCMRSKDERYMGVFLKWRYSEHTGSQQSGLVCKVKYRLTLVNRADIDAGKHFSSNQRFSSSQMILGKSKMVAVDDLLDGGSGFSDHVGRRVVIQLTMYACATRFEMSLDTSSQARQRARKNASGVYFDTPPFLHSGHRWYLRAYPNKTNSGGVPAVYLYLSNRTRQVSMEVCFTLSLADGRTEILTYGFGEGAKYDGFGKTLPVPLSDLDAAQSITVGVEIISVSVFKDVNVTLFSHGSKNASFASYKEYRSGSTLPTGQEQSFQDHEGNTWRVAYQRDAKMTTVTFDKTTGHYAHSKTKMIAATSVLLAQDPDVAQDIDMNGAPLVAYFSNYLDEKGYRMTFPLDALQIEQRGNPYLSENGEVLVRIMFISIQTLPQAVRTASPLDYQSTHILQSGVFMQKQQRNLEDMRDMAASRASLSGISAIDDGSFLGQDNFNKSSSNLLFPMNGSSSKSLDSAILSDVVTSDAEDSGRSFFLDMLRHLAAQSDDQKARTSFAMTSRTYFSGSREDQSTESGVALSHMDDADTLLYEVSTQPSVDELGRQNETVDLLIKFIKQKLPIKITEVVKGGSLGHGTVTPSRFDVDLIFYSPDLPTEANHKWVPAILQTLSNTLQNVMADSPLPDCSYFTMNNQLLQFSCNGIDVDVTLSGIHDNDHQSLFESCSDNNSPSGRKWCSLSSASALHRFINDQSAEVKDVIKVVKQWRNTIHWRQYSHRPNSLLLSLLVIKACEQANTCDLKSVLSQVGTYITASELSIQWNDFYKSETYSTNFDPPFPMVRDPLNPGLNHAETLCYWGQFRNEYSQWLNCLCTNECP